MAPIETSTRVRTADGIVEGIRGRGRRRATISWRGIPFAAPPVAGGRFRAPQPVHPWPGVRDCSAYAKAAIQDKQFTAVAPGKYAARGEDCLTLNVFAPDEPSSEPRPVMVFIHGGAYILGTTATPLYEGSLLAKAQGVIVVSLQYRFGPFGLLDFSAYSTAERTFDANPGFLDMIAGLQWVQKNIDAFGGDPDNVTIFGESAGGSAVQTLLSSPAAAGLFHRAIAESPATELVIGADSATMFADEYLRLLEDPQRRSTTTERPDPIDPTRAQELLSNASAPELHAAGNRLMRFARRVDAYDPMPFAPVAGTPELPLRPLQAALAGKTLPVPLIIGSNRNEGQLFTKLWNILPDADRLMLRVSEPQVRDEIRALYGPRDNIRLSADATFWAPMMAFAEGHREVADTYVYRYDFSTKLLDTAGLGATHAMELFAVFGAFRAPIGVGLALGDWRASGRVTAEVQRRWAEFARTGSPGVGWPDYKPADPRVLVIDDPSHIERDPHADRRRAWARAHAAVG